MPADERSRSAAHSLCPCSQEIDRNAMSTAIMEAQLRTAIAADSHLSVCGCRATALDPTGIAIERHGTTLGIWHWRNGGFELETRGVTDTAVKLETVAETVHYTKDYLCPH